MCSERKKNLKNYDEEGERNGSREQVEDDQLLRQNTSYEDPDEEDASEEKDARKEKKDKKKKNPYASDLSFMIKQRMDFALPQALSGMLCAVLRQIQAVAETELRCKTQGTRRFLTNLPSLGILMGWESLVSTQGKELGMLADMQASVMELSNVRLKFVPPAGWTSPSEKTQAKDESTESQSDSNTHEEETSGWKILRHITKRLSHKGLPSSDSKRKSALLHELSLNRHEGDVEQGGEVSRRLRRSSSTGDQPQDLRPLEEATNSSPTTRTSRQSEDDSMGKPKCIAKRNYRGKSESIWNRVSMLFSVLPSGVDSGHDGDNNERNENDPELSDNPLFESEPLPAGLGDSETPPALWPQSKALDGLERKNMDEHRQGILRHEWGEVVKMYRNKVEGKTVLTVEVELPRWQFRVLPPAVQQGHLVRIVPLVFTQGINEMQTVANKLDHMLHLTEMQDQINMESLELLEIFFAEWQAEIQDHGTYHERTVLLGTLELRLDEIRKQVVESQGSNTKDVEILELTAEFVRQLDGLRITMCKSAKDRTGMSVTLEEARLLYRHHGLKPWDVQQVMDITRSYGVRRENCKKNIGVARFAFNRIQVEALPQQYQPPLNCIGAKVS